MVNILNQAQFLFNKSMASQTWKTYSNSELSFGKFRENYSLPAIWPAPVTHLVHFIAYLSLKAFSSSSIITYVSGISHIHKSRGLVDTTKSFLVSKTLEGIRRTGKSCNIRSPITLSVLRCILPALENVCFSSYESCLFNTAYKLAFFAFLRVGEFTAASRTHSKSTVLQVQDISCSHDSNSLHICIRQSKTDQRGKTTVLVLSAFPDKFLCSIYAIQQY